MDEPKHCDDYIDDPNEPEVLRKYLDRARAPAHGMLSTDSYPKLFADYKGNRVRVVMASQFGDVGITMKLDIECGYTKRVYVAELSNFGDKP